LVLTGMLDDEDAGVQVTRQAFAQSLERRDASGRCGDHEDVSPIGVLH
jgi:hypothetical protein